MLLICYKDRLWVGCNKIVGRLANQGLNLEIRGATSVNGNVSPLIVIDGIVSSSESFMALNSDDIDNISVLKDGELLRSTEHNQQEECC